MKKLFIVFLLTSNLLQTANAAEIRGAPSCGTWIEERPQQNFRAISVEAWLVGFLSGIAAASNEDILHGTDNASLFLWMNNWCRANPLKDVFDGATALTRELKRKSK